jgi:hypothetical protein
MIHGKIPKLIKINEAKGRKQKEGSKRKEAKGRKQKEGSKRKTEGIRSLANS